MTRLVRYSQVPRTEFATKTGLPNAYAFSLADGPVGFGFDGDISIVLTSSLKLGSVLVHGVNESRSLDVPGYDLIEATDPDYSRSSIAEFIGREVKRFGVLKRRPMEEIASSLPYETALILSFENGKRLAAGLNLYDTMTPLAVAEFSEIRREVLRQHVDTPIARKRWLPRWLSAVR
jgi:hypothetical protein